LAYRSPSLGGGLNFTPFFVPCADSPVRVLVSEYAPEAAESPTCARARVISKQTAMERAQESKAVVRPTVY